MKRRQFPYECIDFRSRSSWEGWFSVKQYVEGCVEARALGERVRDRSSLAWTVGAPSVENLTTDWHETNAGRFRIGDPYVYDCQMRQMIGLDVEGHPLLLQPILDP